MAEFISNAAISPAIPPEAVPTAAVGILSSTPKMADFVLKPAIPKRGNSRPAKRIGGVWLSDCYSEIVLNHRSPSD